MVTTTKRVTGTATPFLSGVATGALVSGTLTVIGAAVITWAIMQKGIPETYLGYTIMACLGVSSFCGALVAAGKTKRRRLLACQLSGIMYLIELMLITLLFCGGRFSGVLMDTVCIFMGSTIAAFLGLRGQKGITTRVPKIKTC